MRERWAVLVILFLVIFVSGCEKEISTTTTRTSSPQTPDGDSPQTPGNPQQPANPPQGCGDGKISGSEECDGAVSATCPQGTSGSVKCTGCKIDYTACTSVDCKDSDGGLNYTGKGTVTINNTRAFTDYCRQRGGPFEGYVMEYYCNSTGLASNNYECPRGCNNGACY